MLRFVGVLTIVAAAAVLGTSTAASAQTYWSGPARDVQTHLDEQATLLRSQVAQLTGELREQSRLGAGYRRLYRESTEMFFLADHIHELTHAPLDIAHLAEDVEELDSVFHRMEDTARAVSGGGFHHRSSVHRHHGGGNLNHRLAAIEDTLHHLRDDLQQLQTPRVSPVPAGPTGPSISFGNGRIRFQLGR